MPIYPLRIQVDKPHRTLIVAWDDGTQTVFPWATLRAHCPSAGEKEARAAAARNPLQVLSQVPSSDLVKVRPVGNYAINLVWSDGHSAGIYSWEYLRSLAANLISETTEASGPAKGSGPIGT